MTPILFKYPNNAKNGQLLPKNKIFEKARPNIYVRELFTKQVKKIVWEYKLANETINLSHSESVQEIQIFHIELKEKGLKTDILECIDRTIPSPIIYELYYEDEVKSIAAYKRSNEADSSKWVISNYFETSWLSRDIIRTSLPIVLNLEELYNQLLHTLLPFPAFLNESLRDCVKRMELICTNQIDIEKCKIRLNKEKQFNRKVEINAELRALKQKLETSINPLGITKI